MTLVNPQGVCVAFDADTWDANPAWTRLDDSAGVSVLSWTIDRGRESELDKTKTGTATVTILDSAGVLDPTNPTSPFAGNIDPMKQAAIALQNPVTSDWFTRFRGFVSDWNYEMDIAMGYYTLTLNLVDMFDPLSALEMTPGHHGDVAPADSEGDIYFRGGSTIYASTYKHVNQRILEALADAGVARSRAVVFSGNTTVQDAIYARRDQLLSVIFDAADAEFPGVANVFVSRVGILIFHGRYARFFPERPGYGINTWLAGDGAAADIDFSVALISGLNFRRSKDDIINAAEALPQHVDDSEVPDSLVIDAASILKYGWRSISFDNLLTYQGHDDDGVTVDAIVETKKFADYYVGNYATPKTRVNVIKFRPRDTGNFSGPAVWAVHCEVEIGDLVPLKTTHPGGGGFDEDFYVEGIRQEARPMTIKDGTTEMLEVTTELDVSPRSFFGYNPFGVTFVDNDDMAGATLLPGADGTIPGNTAGYSNEDADADSATSKDPIVQTFTSLFTGPGGDYGDAAADTHNFRTAWYRWTAPAGWSGTSSFIAALDAQTSASVLLMVKCGASGVPPDNGDFVALGDGGAYNLPDSTASLEQTETGDATISPGDDILIGVGSFEDGGDDFMLTWTYIP